MFGFTEIEIHRFWKKIERKQGNQCWPWLAGRQSMGYGVFKGILAHRIVCFFRHGAPPEGKPYAIHSCDNPICCNPRHLRWGAPKDNVRDAMDRNRHSKPPKNASYRKANPRRGESNPDHVLTDAIVYEIWRRHLNHEPMTRL